MGLPLVFKLLGWAASFLPFGSIIKMGLDIAYSLIIKLLGLIFYLASEYWGRWVLAAIVVALGLLYGRYHYIQQGRHIEARFCEVRIDHALKARKPARGTAKPRSGWPF